MVPFLAIKGSRVLEKKVNETGIKNCVSHLNPAELHKRTKTSGNFKGPNVQRVGWAC